MPTLKYSDTVSEQSLDVPSRQMETSFSFVTRPMCGCGTGTLSKRVQSLRFYTCAFVSISLHAVQSSQQLNLHATQTIPKQVTWQCWSQLPSPWSSQFHNNDRHNSHDDDHTNSNTTDQQNSHANDHHNFHDKDHQKYQTLLAFNSDSVSLTIKAKLSEL